MGERLFSTFSPVTKKEWEAQVSKDLKKPEDHKKLSWKNNEQLSVSPFYTRESLPSMEHLSAAPSSFPYVRGNRADHNSWEIQQNIIVEDISTANSHALDCLQKGVNSLCFICRHSLTEADMNSLLQGILIEYIAIHFQASTIHLPGIAQSFQAEIKNRKLDATTLKGSFGFDPLFQQALKGERDPSAAEHCVRFYQENKNLSSFQLFTVNARHIGNSGGNNVQELAIALSAGNEYLKFFVAKGMLARTINQHLLFSFSIGSNFFFEIAKIRAARLLWAGIVNAYQEGDSAPAVMHIHAETSTWNITLYDPYVNLLRATTETMSASMAGVDWFTVHPWDMAYGKSHPFSERMARNIQLVLQHEAYLDKVVDPAAGSYYIESLTQEMAQESWKLFQQIEKQHGFSACLKNSFIPSMINATAADRKQQLATRKEILLGTNQYPNAKEQIADNIKEHTTTNSDNKPTFDRIHPGRAAEAFEALRLKTEKSGKKPKVFLLAAGNLTMRMARSMFSANFMACAGFEIISNNGYDKISEALAEAAKQKADITVLCSSDEEYEQLVPEAAKQLKGKTLLLLAGHPGENETNYRAAGIDEFIHARSNLVDTLENIQEKVLQKEKVK